MKSTAIKFWVIFCLVMLNPGARFVCAQGKTNTASCEFRGQILDPAGEPVESADVRLHRWNSETSCWSPAERTAESDTDGHFGFDELPPDEFWCLRVTAANTGLRLHSQALKSGEHCDIKLTLSAPVNAFFTIVDEDGKPLAGAIFRSYAIADEDRNLFFVQRQSECDLKIDIAVSDENGHLPLPPFCTGTSLDGFWIDHPTFSAKGGNLKTPLFDGELDRVYLQPGFPLRIAFVDEDNTPTDALNEVSVRLLNNVTSHDTSIIDTSYPVKNSNLTVAMSESQFRIFILRSSEHFITPNVVQARPATFAIKPDTNDRWNFRVVPKVSVAGRIIDEHGQPVAGAPFRGEIENLMADGTLAPGEWGQWAFADSAASDENGEFRIRLAKGRGRVFYQGIGIPSSQITEVVVSGSDGQRIPDIVVKDLPTINGRVLDSDGHPVSHAVVRIHSASSVRYTLPVVTGSDGSFHIPLEALPTAEDTDEAAYEHQVFAYLPNERRGGVVTLDLRNRMSCQELEIALSNHPAEWPLSEMTSGFSAWEKGDGDSRPDKIRTNKNSVGAIVPGLDGEVWLNTGLKSLSEFQGRFILLDFYTTWCGPCQRDFPSVQAVHDLFSSQDVAVIAIHDNSSPMEKIRSHAAEKGMAMPIVVDHSDGRILNAWNKIGLTRGYPSYVVLDREGRLLASDDSTPGPLLRNYKIEIVRQILLKEAEKRE